MSDRRTSTTRRRSGVTRFVGFFAVSAALSVAPAFAVGPASNAEAAEVSRSARPIAHLTKTALDVNADGSTVRLVNDTAFPLEFSSPSVVPETGGVARFQATAKVFDATITPPAPTPGATAIPVGGYIELIVTVTGTAAAKAELRIAARTVPRPDRRRRGRVFTVALQAFGSKPEPAAKAVTTDVKTLTIERTTHLGLSPTFPPFKTWTTTKGETLPVTFAGDCTNVKEFTANLTSDQADSALVTAKCKDKDNLRFLVLNITGASETGATYNGALRIGADKDSDVTLKLEQQVAAEIALIVLLAGIAFGLIFQRHTKVTAVLRRLRAEIDGLRTKWVINEDPSGPTIDEAVKSLRERMKTALTGMRTQHVLALSDTDPDVVAMTADIGVVKDLEIVWDAFASAARRLRELASAAAPNLPGVTQLNDPRPVVLRSDTLLEERDLAIGDLPALDKEVRAHLEIFDRWNEIADIIVNLFPDLPPDKKRSMEVEFKKLWVTSDPDRMQAIDEAVNTAAGEAVVDAARRRREFQPFDGILGVNYYRGDSGAHGMQAGEYEGWSASVAQAAERIGTTLWSAARRWGYAALSWLLVSVALFVVAWTGFETTWLSSTNLGWSGLGAAFVWGLVTPTALDLLGSAIERLRTGARVYYAQLKPAGD